MITALETWTENALCRNVADGNIFFDKYETDVIIAKEVDEFCMQCPVFKQCHTIGREKKQHGVWGAVYWNGKGGPSKKYNIHKTQEIWDKIDELANKHSS